MFRSLFGIIWRPQLTLQQVLEERRFARSWGVTFLMAVLQMLTLLILGIFAFHKISALVEQAGGLSGFSLPQNVGLALFAGGVLWLLVSVLIQLVVGRFAFSWIVRLGLRISAGSYYPRDKQERRENGGLLRLLHPYTLWMSQLPSYVMFVILAFLLGVLPTPNLSALQGAPDQQAAIMKLLIVFIIWALILDLLYLGMWIYMIIVRTIAIQKIYSISAARAFWGPFLIYFVLYCIFFVLYFMFIIMAQMHGGTPVVPGSMM